MNKYNYYVIGEYDDYYSLLHLYGEDLEDAKHMIWWQGQGTVWHICTPTNTPGQFIDQKGLEIIPKNTIFTEAAWSDFMNRVWPEKKD